uniref:Uncharacterized protein n=1 Tax=viral metagenome TaxID=1070528 RepID=A0A6C0EBT5_9ZZZZ
MYDYVIFHKNCFDGFTGFIILNGTNKIEKHASIYPDVPSAKNVPPNIENKNVIIIDVAYNYDVLKEIMTRAKSVLFIDHHVTIKEDVEKITKELNNKNHIVIYDDTQSGSTLTWKYFYPKKSRPLFIKYVDDNDTGQWRLKHTREFLSSLEVNYKTDLSHDNISKWNKLYDSSIVKKLIKLGKRYIEYKTYITEHNAKRYSLELFPSNKIYEEYTKYFSKPAQYKVALYCGSGCPSSTSLASKILESVKCDFVIMWTLNMEKKEYVLSFRSENVDVGEIASIFGGGGHKLAAACSFNINKFRIEDLFFENSLPRR